VDYTVDEIIVACISRQIKNGEMVVQGLATPLVAAGYLLARYTHAPDLYFASAIGQSVCRIPAPMGLTNIESLWLDRSLASAGFVQVAAEILPTLKPKEFFRPAQVDQNGNFNNIAFGKDYRQPRFRLPGSGGIPDVTTFIDNIYLYVTRHSKLTFVKKLDFLSGLGHNPARTHGSGPVYLVSDLGQFDFADGKMRLVSFHPGVAVEKIQSQTGFDLEIAPGAAETPPPTREELRLLREEIDPSSIRRLETLSGSERRSLLAEILRKEQWIKDADLSMR
jgi:acyl CoA:acetate/3-ketoacid CoA transferase beta subunit